jgi:hypothetical protein
MLMTILVSGGRKSGWKANRSSPSVTKRNKSGKTEHIMHARSGSQILRTGNEVQPSVRDCF